MDHIGKLIKDKRIELGLSIDDLHKKSGVSTAAISNIENGKIKEPREHTKRKLLLALGMTSEDEKKENEGKKEAIGLKIKGRATEISIVVFTEVSNMEIEQSEEERREIYDFEAPIIRKEIFEFIKEHKDEIVDRFVKKINEELDKRRSNQFVVEEQPTD